LNIVGSHHGFFQKKGLENDSVISKINAVAPDILLVGMGMPTQEFWIDDNIDRLNAKTYIPVGAAFRWYSGIDKRAPKWVTDYGFEWLARFISHPNKFFERYGVGNPLCFIRIFKTELLKYHLPSKCNKAISSYCSDECEFF
jgi:N-acetylglucosaminyldiphosphoundecaprenol N-acetyl-beta-D-mannosaminyltransferase